MVIANESQYELSFNPINVPLHVFPLNPGTHSHSNVFSSALQRPSFSHGLGEHGSGISKKIKLTNLVNVSHSIGNELFISRKCRITLIQCYYRENLQIS
jgi:hypothetical protein